jgi:betaine-aldehyde dehydrogenase
LLFGLITTSPLYINGEFVAPQSSATLDVVDPATTEVIGRVPDASAADVDRAVRAARVAFDEGPWKDTTAQERGRVLFRLAEAVRSRATELAELETRNSGKPIVEAEFDVEDVATCFEYYGGLATKIHGDVVPVPDNAMSLALREPIGVAGQIVPWNYPLLMASWKLAPAICAGCTTILKPAEQTPLSVLALASSFADAGLPPGVVNIITGSGETAGAALASHPGIDKVAFTGSVEVGKIIMRSASATLKKIS